MQNAGIEQLGLNWRYLAFDVKPENLQAAVRGAAALQCIGLNLTVPHKLLAMEMMDLHDASAREWGAVNTVRFEGRLGNGEWLPLRMFEERPPDQVRSHGFNTDADAIERSLREDLGVELTGSRVVLLGAGGAGRVAALKLAAEGARELFLVNRTRSKAEAIAEEIANRFPHTAAQVGYPRGDVDLLLNATSLGLAAADPIPVEGAEFSLKQARCVYDMVYRPAETQLLQAARQAGCATANGLGMLLYQGARALEIWSGQPAPVEVMRSALQKHIYGS